jgi:hypothetical protein
MGEGGVTPGFANSQMLAQSFMVAASSPSVIGAPIAWGSAVAGSRITPPLPATSSTAFLYTVSS